MEGAIEAKSRIDVAREIIRRRDDRLERRPDEIVAMGLASGQGARVAAQKWEMGLQCVTERHSFRLLRVPTGYGVARRFNATLRDGPLLDGRLQRIVRDSPPVCGSGTILGLFCFLDRAGQLVPAAIRCVCNGGGANPLAADG
jgi:hypothetical protein